MQSQPRPAATFLKRFLHNPKQVGAVWPSSSALGRAMIADLPVPIRGVVVELGPGTGALTRNLWRAMGPQARYLGIEREASFVRHLRSRPRYADLQFVHGSAEDLGEHLQAAGLPAPQLIVSGLPLILMPPSVMESIVTSAAKALAPGGHFRTFSYIHSRPLPNVPRLRALMQECFATYSISAPVWRNMPPAHVYRGTMLAANAES